MQQRLSIAATSRKLGDVAARTGDLNMALDLLEESLQMQRSVHGEGAHPDIAVTLSQLGDVTAQTGDLKKSLQYLEASLRMQYSLHGEIDHPDIATTLHKLGDVTSQTADLKTAKEHLEASLKMQLALYRGALPPGPAAAADSLQGRLDVTFPSQGLTGKRFTLYQVQFPCEKLGESWMIELRPQYPPLVHKPKDVIDVGYAHDVCCGLGGFSCALEVVGSRVLTAVDSSPLALAAFQLNHNSDVLCQDIGSTDTVVAMRKAQINVSCQPLVTAGFPCQPWAKQGSQRGQLDLRSQVLKPIARSVFWLQSSGLLLECVPEAARDPSTQATWRALAHLMDFDLRQKVLHLQSIWPARRSRWFVLIPRAWNLPGFPDLPTLSQAPTVRDLIPSETWPLWSEQDEQQLRWTELELQVYRNPAYAQTDRRVKQDEPLPTAPHSWANALYACPCECRSQGLSPQALLNRGLRGIEVVSSQSEGVFGLPWRSDQSAYPSRWCHAGICHRSWAFSFWQGLALDFAKFTCCGFPCAESTNQDTLGLRLGFGWWADFDLPYIGAWFRRHPCSTHRFLVSPLESSHWCL